MMQSAFRGALRGLLVAAFTGTVFAGEPLLVVDARAATDGAKLAALRCALAQEHQVEPYARFEGAVYSGTRRPKAGEILYVYHRGYDLVRVVLPEDPREVSVQLQPAGQSCMIVITGEGAEDLVARRGLALNHSFRSTNQRRDGMVRDSYVTRPTILKGSVRWGRGMYLSTLCEADIGIVWPVVWRASDGQEVELRYERGRPLRIRRGAGQARQAAFVECLPDLLWTPSASPEQVDAWRWHLNGPGWLRDPLMAGAERVHLVPDVPFHMFVQLGEQRIYRYVAPGAEEVDLRNPFPSRAVSGRPTTGGRPIRSGTILAPGRLDLYTISALASLRSRSSGFCFEAPAGDDWPDVSLPTAEWLTAWHPEEGLAHFEWNPDGTTSGESYRSLVSFAAPEGWAATGHVSLYPVWKGAGGVRTAPPDKGLRRRLDGAPSVFFRGVAPGRYAADIRLRLRHVQTGAVREVGRITELDVTAEKQMVEVSLAR